MWRVFRTYLPLLCCLYTLPVSGQGYFDFLFARNHSLAMKWNGLSFDSIPYPLRYDGLVLTNLDALSDCFGNPLLYYQPTGGIWNHNFDTVINNQTFDFSLGIIPVKQPNSHGKIILLGPGQANSTYQAQVYDPAYNGIGRLQDTATTILAINSDGAFPVFKDDYSFRMFIRGAVAGLSEVYSVNVDYSNFSAVVEDSISRVISDVIGFGSVMPNEIGNILYCRVTVMRNGIARNMNAFIKFDTITKTFHSPILISQGLLGDAGISLTPIKLHENYFYYTNRGGLTQEIRRLDLSTWDSTSIVHSLTPILIMNRTHGYVRDFYNNSTLLFKSIFNQTNYIYRLIFPPNSGGLMLFDSVGSIPPTGMHFNFFVSDLMLNATQPRILGSGFCLGDTANFSINDSDFVQYAYWNFGDPGSGTSNLDTGMRVQHVFSQAGTYIVRLISQYCNRTPDTTYRQITIAAPPIQPQLPDTFFCASSSLPLHIQPVNGQQYLWSTGDTLPHTNISNGGWHWVEQRNACFSRRDSFYVEAQLPPQAGLPLDTNLCVGDVLVLSPATSAYSWRWQDGSTQPLQVTQSGTYALLMTNACGTFVHESRVQFHEAPALELNDTSRCEGQFLRVELPEFWQADYRWSDGPTERIRLLTDSGWYEVRISNPCGESSSEMYLRLTDCVCHMYLPTAFSPNGDGLNDQLTVATRCELSQFEMEVYDRWGRLLFRSNQLNRGWDGHFNGQLMPPGAYPFVIRYTPEGRNARVEKGVVNLLR